jgi:RNA polymerase sigma-70 factor, ECF subfamily
MQTRALTLKDPCLNGQVLAERRLEFEDLVTRLLPSFRRLAMRLLRNTEDAEDAVQDALLSAFRNIAQFEERAQMSTWLMAIIANAARMKLRRRPRCHMVAIEEGPEEGGWAISQMIADHRPTPEESVERWQLSALVNKLIGGLPDSQRSALCLRCDDFSIGEVAEVLGVPVGTVKARLARGRAKLMERFHKTTSATRSRILGPDSKARSKLRANEPLGPPCSLRTRFDICPTLLGRLARVGRFFLDRNQTASAH